MFLGTGLEVAGYVGRYRQRTNPFLQTNFLLNIICLTIGPAFLTASIYLCLARIIMAYGSANARFKPAVYTTTFMLGDFVSLVLQGAGGGIASTANGGSSGTNIMIAGLAFQVASLFFFILLSLDFAVCLRRGRGARNADFQRLTGSLKWKGFLLGEFRSASSRCLSETDAPVRSLGGRHRDHLHPLLLPRGRALQGLRVRLCQRGGRLLHPRERHDRHSRARAVRRAPGLRLRQHVGPRKLLAPGPEAAAVVAGQRLEWGPREGGTGGRARNEGRPRRACFLGYRIHGAVLGLGSMAVGFGRRLRWCTPLNPRIKTKAAYSSLPDDQVVRDLRSCVRCSVD